MAPIAIKKMKISITVDNLTIETSSSESILEALEKNGIYIDSQCREGYCGVCRCKRISGEVKYAKEPIAYINDGEVLACSAAPLSDLVIKL